MTIFHKRTFSLPVLIESTVQAARYLPTMVKGLIAPKTSRALQEQVMLAVTSVNDCRYCDWVHTGLALKADVDVTALQELLSLGGFDPKQAQDPQTTAILYAQHFTDQSRRPTAEATARLQQVFSAAQVDEIMACIHAIYFANLSGNSFDALLARLKGQSVEQGHLVAELLAAGLSAPILIGIWLKSRGFKA